MSEIRRRFRQTWQLYLFLLIPLTYIIVFCYIPMGGIVIAFNKYKPATGFFGSRWVGFTNFTDFFSAYRFERILTNTLTLSLYGMIAGFPIPIIFALLVNTMRNKYYKKLVQSITCFPYFISTVVMVGMIMQVLNPRVGIYGLFLKSIGVFDAADPMSIPAAFPHIYVLSGIWQGFGWNSIIYIAGLASVDPALDEAMRIDGASRFQRVIHLDFPSILPQATILLIMSAGGIMNVGFEKVLLLQNSMNLPKSDVIATYVYEVGLSSATGNFSYGTAVGLFNSVINFILLIIVNTIAGRLDGTTLW